MMKLLLATIMKPKKTVLVWSCLFVALTISVFLSVNSGFAPPAGAAAVSESVYAHRPLIAYAFSPYHDDIIGELQTYVVQKGETLLDIGRRFGLTAQEISDANHGLDWWLPPPGKTIILPTQWILPPGPREGLVLNIPEMRLYFFPGRIEQKRRKNGVKEISYISENIVYTFPVGLGRYDWRTPIASFHVRGKTVNPTWVAPLDIYKEHLENDPDAERVIPGGDPENPLGKYRIELSIPEYAIHGTNKPWGVGMLVSHGCIRLYPEDIEKLFYKVKIGTPGRFVYYPVKFGWKGDALYVEVHRDIYGKYPGLWQFAMDEARRMGIEDKIDMKKLEQAIIEKTGIPTYVMPGEEPEETSAKR